MTTLKEFLWEECLQHLDLGENGPYDEMQELENDLNTAIQKWLENKLKAKETELKELPSQFRTHMNGEIFAIVELIKEVSPKTVESIKSEDKQ